MKPLRLLTSTLLSLSAFLILSISKTSGLTPNVITSITTTLTSTTYSLLTSTTTVLTSNFTTSGLLVWNPNLLENTFWVGLLLFFIPLIVSIKLGLLGFAVAELLDTSIGIFYHKIVWWAGIAYLFMILVVLLLYHESGGDML